MRIFVLLVVVVSISSILPPAPARQMAQKQKMHRMSSGISEFISPAILLTF
jgi:hypothetical protein